jgi:hypothetical protein
MKVHFNAVIMSKEDVRAYLEATRLLQCYESASRCCEDTCRVRLNAFGGYKSNLAFGVLSEALMMLLEATERAFSCRESSFPRRILE